MFFRSHVSDEKHECLGIMIITGAGSEFTVIRGKRLGMNGKNFQFAVIAEGLNQIRGIREASRTPRE